VVFLGGVLRGEFKMRALPAFACVLFLSAAFLPATAQYRCGGSRCALSGVTAGPRQPGHALLGKCCRPVPSGWGWYLRQKLRDDTAPPLVIVDELGGVTLYRGQR